MARVASAATQGKVYVHATGGKLPTRIPGAMVQVLKLKSCSSSNYSVTVNDAATVMQQPTLQWGVDTNLKIRP